MKKNLFRESRSRDWWLGAMVLALFATLAGAQPANDDFQNAAVITGAGGFVSGSNGGATLQAGEPDHADEQGGASVWWRWTAPADGIVVFHTFGSDFDTLLAVYTGDSVDALDFVAANDDVGFVRESMIIIEAVAGTTYRIAVDGYDMRNLGAATGTIALHWAGALANDGFDDAALITGASGITAALSDGAGNEPDEPDHGGNAGGASLWWQWTAPESAAVSFNTFDSDFDTLLAVYTGDDIGALTLIAASDDGVFWGGSMVNFVAHSGTTYRIAVDGHVFGNGLDPETGTVVLNWGPAIANDDFAFAELLSGSNGAITARNSGATLEEGEPRHADGVGWASLWWIWTASESGEVAFDTFGSNMDTLLAIYTGDSVGALTLVADNDDSWQSESSLASFTAVAGTTYRIAVDSWEGEMGTLVLHWGPPPANDNFGQATALAGISGSTTARNVGAGSEDEEPNHADEPAQSSIWWQWTASQSGVVAFDTFGSDFDTVLAVYTGSSLAELLPVAGNDDDNGNAVSRVGFVAVAGTTYQIVVDGYDGEFGTVLLHWGPPPASFATWITGFGLSGDAAAPDADPDKDGLPNAAEYALGGNPADAAASPRPAAAVSGGNLIFSFARDDASETPDVTLTVESGTDFLTWPSIFHIGPVTATSSPGVGIVENGTGPDTITIAIPRAGSDRMFARLKVTIFP